RFVYFGGGTPSYLSTTQLRSLFGVMRELIDWEPDAEVTFECEPGTLQMGKLELLHELGVTRLSLGVENFDPGILELNNRAHRAKEIYDVFAAARKVGFAQINIDLIAGMVGETDENWTRCLEETVRLLPDSVTLYQMEVPHNTTLFQRMKDGRTEVAPVADWDTKRRWAAEGFERLEAAGYRVGSAYTAARGEATFVYRDALWHGADLLGVGVSSFSHVGGVHFQNDLAFESYVRRVEAGEPPLWRGMRLTDDERMVRELVLQMKLGDVDTTYFERKFGVDLPKRFAPQLETHARQGWLSVEGDRIRASRAGLLRIDSLLPDYFLEEHRDARYW
ncbi:MAG: coproporphyrinogen-III oxidase family protein, partial [Planctomycetota bacterium]|nr:coproporphyrinogen-III oxidase family protein [Planctomycetota bacterium]